MAETPILGSIEVVNRLTAFIDHSAAAGEVKAQARAALGELRGQRDEAEAAVMRLPKPAEELGDGPDERVSAIIAENAKLREERDEARKINEVTGWKIGEALAAMESGDVLEEEIHAAVQAALLSVPPGFDDATLAIEEKVREANDAQMRDVEAAMERFGSLPGEGLPELLGRLCEERDEARGVLATTADRLGTALREANRAESVGDPYRTLSIRDGIVSLYDWGAGLRAQLAAANEEIRRLEAAAVQDITERDRANDVIQAVHVALGGDGVWCAKPGQACAAGETGDLAIDTPVLAEEVMARLAEQAAEVKRERARADKLFEEYHLLERERDRLARSRRVPQAAEVERLRTRLETAEQQARCAERASEDADRYHSERDAALAREAATREALKFYSDPESYKDGIQRYKLEPGQTRVRDSHYRPQPVMADRGKKARTALQSPAPVPDAARLRGLLGQIEVAAMGSTPESNEAAILDIIKLCRQALQGGQEGE